MNLIGEIGGRFPYFKNHDGSTPLFDAVMHKNVDCVKLLLQHGADPHRKCRGDMSAFDLARASAEYAEVMECIQTFLRTGKTGKRVPK